MILALALALMPQADLDGLWVCQASQARARLTADADGYTLTGAVDGRLQPDIASPTGWAFRGDSWAEADVGAREITIRWQRQRTAAGYLLSDVTRLTR